MTNLVVPLYIYPKTPATWDAIVAAKQAHPKAPIVAIINPNSGPGTAKDPNYAVGISYLKANGIKTLGYIATTYGNKPLGAIITEIDSHMAWYAPTGLFFDEVASTGQEQYLKTINAYAVAHGSKLTIGNPGVEIPQTYVGTLDDFCIFEGAGLPSLPGIGGDSCISYAVSPFALPVGYDYVFVTNQPLETAYSVMSPYLMELAAAFDSPPAAPLPIRPTRGLYLVGYRAGGAPFSVVESSVWLEQVNSNAVRDSVKGLGYWSLMETMTQMPGGIGMIQNSLLIAPDKVSWVPQVIAGLRSPLHYFEVDLVSVNGPMLQNAFVAFTYSDGLMGLKITDGNTGNTIIEQYHSIPGKFTVDGIDYSLQPIKNSYIAAAGYGAGSAVLANSSTAFFPSDTLLKVVRRGEPDPALADLSFALWNAENPPGGFELIGEQSNLYATYPEIVEPSLTTNYLKVGPWA